LIEFVEFIILNYYSKVDNCSGFWDMVIRVLTKPSWEIRKQLISTIENSHENCPELSNCLFRSYLSYINEQTNQSPDEEKLRGGMRPLNANALGAIISSNLSIDNFSRLVVVAHHPVVAPPRSSTLFTKLVRKMNLDLEATVSEHKSAISSYIFSNDVIGHSHTLHRQAAVSGICGLVKLTKNLLVVQELIQPLETFINDLPNRWSKLTKEELGIFRTPEGEVWAVDKLQVTPATNDKKKTADQKWEEELRQKQLEKQGVLEKEAQAKKEKVLQDEQTIRIRVRELYDQIIVSIDLTKDIGETDPIALDQSLFIILPHFLQLLKFPDLEWTIENLLLTVARKSFHPTNLGQTLAKLLFVTYSAKGLSHAQLTEIYVPFIEKVCGSFKDMLAHQFALILPILSEILLSDHPDHLQDSALFLIERHVLFPSVDVLKTLIFLIGNSQLFLQRAREALISYCTRLDGKKEYSNVKILVDNLLSEFVDVRMSCIEGLSKIWNIDSIDTPLVISRIFLAQHDTTKEIAEIAQDLYGRLTTKLRKEHVQELLPLLGNPDKVVRSIIAKSISASIAVYPGNLSGVYTKLFGYYKNYIPDEKQKKYEAQMISSWHYYREGVAQSLAECSVRTHTAEQVNTVFNFLIKSALRDENETVLAEFVVAGKR